MKENNREQRENIEKVEQRTFQGCWEIKNNCFLNDGWRWARYIYNARVLGCPFTWNCCTVAAEPAGAYGTCITPGCPAA